MARANDSKTRVTLLHRLRHDPDDPAAWAEFVEHYGRKVLAWCRKWGLQQADAEDVTQDVLLKLAARMRQFEYDPARSFRAWLKTVTQRTLIDFGDARRRTARGSGDTETLRRLEGAEASDDLLRHLEEEFERELLAEASARVRLRVEPHTWEAFRLTALEGLSGAEAAERTGMKVATVFVARSKVQKMLQQEVKNLEAGE
jgi:RNA polymerase sigma-70 factor (ECF subfamily)